MGLTKGEILTVYSQGFSLRETARKLGATYNTVFRVVRAAGVGRNRKDGWSWPQGKATAEFLEGQSILRAMVFPVKRLTLLLGNGKTIELRLEGWPKIEGDNR